MTRPVTLFALVSLSFVSFVPAAGAELRPGIDVGPSFVWIAYEDKLPEWTETGDRLDWSGGVTAELPFAGRWGLLSGVRYSGLGNRVEYTTLSGTGQLEVHQQYVVVPLWLRLHVPGLQGLFVQAGPEFGYLFAAELHNDEAGEHVETKILDLMKRRNVSLSGGVGVQRAVGPRTLELLLRYSRGIVDTNEPEQWFTTWKTREFHVGLGLR